MNLIKAKKIMLLAGDVFMLFASLPIALLLAFRNEFNLEMYQAHLFPFLGIYFFILVAFYVIGLYDLRFFKPATSLLPSIFMVNLAGGVFGAVLFYILNNPSITPKTNLAISIAASCLLIWLWRALFQRYMGTHLKINVAIAGINEHARELAQIIELRPYMGYNIAAVIATDSLFSAESLENKKVFLPDENLAANLQREGIGTVITAENPHLNPALAQAFYECIPHKIKFLDLAQSYELLTGRIPISYISQTWFLENINEKKQLYDTIKRVTDAIVAFLIFVTTLPFIPLIIFAIKWESKGPAFYSQERVGQNKRLFHLIKFRSMIRDAESGKPIWAQEHDPRVTRVGAFLRRTHLDELPQMINIIKGDLSLVGPRPERIEFVRELEGQIPHYNIRHIIKPGFTGWAQVNFRYARTPMDTYEKFQYDLYYLKNRSFVLDIAILLKTLNLFFRTG